MAFTTVTGSNGITSLVGTTGVDTATIVSLADKVFVGANTEDDVLIVSIGTGGNNASDYNVRMGGGDDNITFNNTILNSFISLDGETLANDGNDTFLATGATQLIINSEIVGRGGNDNFGTAGNRIRLQGSTVNGNTGLDTIFLGASSSSEVYGGQDTDTITTTGDQTAMMINGNKGADTITLGAGTFSGSVFGGQGADTISAANIANTGDGANLSGDDGNDTVTGSGRIDTITGGAGADSITGGGLGDTLSGGAGADTFVYANGDSVVLTSTTGFDTISDFAASAAAGDLINVGGVAGFQARVAAASGGASLADDLAGAYGGNGFATTQTITGSVAWAGNYILDDTNADGVYDAADTVIKVSSIAGVTAATFI